MVELWKLKLVMLVTVTFIEDSMIT